MKLPIRTQPDTLTRLKAQRDLLTKRLQDAEQKLERIDALDAGELIALEDDLSTTRRTLALVAERITAAELSASQVATAEQEAQRLEALVTEQKEYDGSLQAVVKDVQKLDASLQTLVTSYRRLALLGAMGAGDTVLSLAPAVQRALFALQFTAPELLGLPARNPQEEQRQADIADCTARLERAERRRDALKDAARQGYTVRGVDFDAANADVKTAKRQLALASGREWTPQDEAAAERTEGLVFTARSPAEVEASLLRQTRAQDVAGPARYTPTPPPRRR